jgi:hypothetical protein
MGKKAQKSKEMPSLACPIHGWKHYSTHATGVESTLLPHKYGWEYFKARIPPCFLLLLLLFLYLIFYI